MKYKSAMFWCFRAYPLLIFSFVLFRPNNYSCITWLIYEASSERQSATESLMYRSIFSNFCYFQNFFYIFCSSFLISVSAASSMSRYTLHALNFTQHRGILNSTGPIIAILYSKLHFVPFNNQLWQLICWYWPSL